MHGHMQDQIEVPVHLPHSTKRGRQTNFAAMRAMYVYTLTSFNSPSAIPVHCHRFLLETRALHVRISPVHTTQAALPGAEGNINDKLARHGRSAACDRLTKLPRRSCTSPMSNVAYLQLRPAKFNNSLRERTTRARRQKTQRSIAQAKEDRAKFG